jgi:L-lactate dehydrogenase complex protein LldG
MSDARSAVLARIRQALGRTPEEEPRARERVAAWSGKGRPGFVPARGQLAPEDRIGLFIEYARAVQTEVERVTGPAAIPAVVARYLRRHNLPQKLVMAPEPALDEADWASQPLLRIRRGTADDGDLTGVPWPRPASPRPARCSSPRPPTADAPRLSAGDLHRRSRHRPDRRLLRAGIQLHLGETGSLPRSLNFVTGPSRTGDIAQKLELGAHGPKHLFVVLVDPEPADREPADQRP